MSKRPKYSHEEYSWWKEVLPALIIGAILFILLTGGDGLLQTISSFGPWTP